MKNPVVYLDYNATTPVDPGVLEEMIPYFSVKYGNSSSRHSYGFEAESAAKVARKRISALINGDPDEFYFTSGATESINIVHQGVAKAYSSQGRHIISSNIEHPAVIESLQYLKQNGFSISFIPVNSEGLIDLNQLGREIRKDTILVSLMAANNEIGVVNDLEIIGNICSEKNVLFHTDASQALGKLEIDVMKMKIDMLSFSGHKFYAPKGTGGLFIRQKKPQIRIAPFFFGGGQEKGIRPGTLNIPSVVGLGKAAALCMELFSEETKRIKSLRDQLFEGLKKNIQGLVLNGSYEARLPNNLNLRIKDVRADKLMMELRDLAFSTGSACASGSDKPSYVLKALGLDDESVYSSVRLGLGRFSTSFEIDYTINRITEAVNKIRNYPQNKRN